ncbi:hypothetical protein ACLM5H_15655 [Fredinandcohnia humi]
MIMKYEFLYKNGHEDVINLEVTEDNVEKIESINKIIQLSMEGDVEGYITLGNGETEGHTIRVSDISRVKVTCSE